MRDCAARPIAVCGRHSQAGDNSCISRPLYLPSPSSPLCFVSQLPQDVNEAASLIFFFPGLFTAVAKSSTAVEDE